MDYQKQLVRAQENANEIQEKLKDVIEKNNKLTSGHNRQMVLLTIVIIILSIFTLISYLNQTGRYALATVGTTGAAILDTKTSKLWVRSGPKKIYFGTVQNPTVEFTTFEDDKTE